VERSLGPRRITDEANIEPKDVPEYATHIAPRSSARFDDFFFPWRLSWRSRWGSIESPMRLISIPTMPPTYRHILHFDRRNDSTIFFFFHGELRGESLGPQRVQRGPIETRWILIAGPATPWHVPWSRFFNAFLIMHYFDESFNGHHRASINYFFFK